MEFQKDLFITAILLKRIISNRHTVTKSANEIGISKATLSRVERGFAFQMETFVKILDWLKKEPNHYIN